MARWIHFLSFVGLCLSHTIMITPEPRERSVHSNAGNYQCGTRSDIQATYTRGQVVRITWGRNNHHGGFSQLSVLPLSRASGGAANNPGVIADFLDPQNIFHVSCYNSGPRCFSCNGCSDKFGLGGDGTDFQQTICENSFTVPSWLDDGEYVMKWTVFGNGDSFGVRNMPHGNYLNCHNFRVSGGQAKIAKPGGNNHIEFKLTDNAIQTTNQRTQSTYPQGQCMFNGGANNGQTCKFIDGQRSALCTGPVAALAKCGGGTADSRQECLGNNNDGQAQGGDLYNYMLGLPSFHPDYKGTFTLLSHNRANRVVSLSGSVTPDTGTGGNTGGGSCDPSGNCIKTPNCCPAGKLCYEKDQYWADCRDINSCVPGIHADDPPQYQTPWSCRPLGISTGTRPIGIFWQGNGDRVVDSSGSRNQNGNAVWMWNNLGPGNAQQWVKNSCGTIQWFKTNKCLDVPGGRDFNGNKIQIWDCDCNNPNQLFDSTDFGGYRWRNRNKCLDVEAGGQALGTRLQIWDCFSSNINQKFKEQPVLQTTISKQKLEAYANVSSQYLSGTEVTVDWSARLGGQNDTAIFVRLNSTVHFKGADNTTNPVVMVCEDAFVSAGPENATIRCDGSEISYLTPGEFTPKEEGTTFFIGNAWNDNQKLTVIATNALSVTDPEAVNSINSVVAPDAATTAPTPAPTASSSNNNLPIIVGSVVGGVVVIAILVGIVVWRVRSSGSPNHPVRLM